jgi:hypothetical protein
VNTAVQLVGAILILAAFALAQWGVFDQKSRRYLVCNVVGSVLLFAAALAKQQWGFVLLEGVWAIVSAVSLVRVFAGPGRHAAGRM